MKTDACLTLVLPKSLEEQVIDHLLAHPEWVGPFTAHVADGHGAPGAFGSVEEEVRGRAHRVRIEILIEAAHARDLVAHLREDLGGAELFWWLSPVIESGSFS